MKYSFSLEKKFQFEGQTQLDLITEGTFDVTKEKQQDKLTSFSFVTNSFKQKKVKEPLIFSPFNWEYNNDKHSLEVMSKRDIELTWKKYRDKFISKENKITFLVLERVFFNMPKGLENYSLSHSYDLPFFIDVTNDIKVGDIIEGPSWLLIPAIIPVNTYYKCIYNSEKIVLNGWLSVDKEKLDSYLLSEIFRSKAKNYHYSQEFNIDSKIEIHIDKKDLNLIKAIFELNIKGDDDLSEVFKYKINNNKSTFFETLGLDPKKNDPNDVYVIGKPKIIDHW